MLTTQFQLCLLIGWPNASGGTGMRGEFTYGTELSGWRQLLRKINPFAKPYRSPRFVSTILAISAIGASSLFPAVVERINDIAEMTRHSLQQTAMHIQQDPLSLVTYRQQFIVENYLSFNGAECLMPIWATRYAVMISTWNSPTV